MGRRYVEYVEEGRFLVKINEKLGGFFISVNIKGEKKMIVLR